MAHTIRETQTVTAFSTLIRFIFDGNAAILTEHNKNSDSTRRTLITEHTKSPGAASHDLLDLGLTFYQR